MYNEVEKKELEEVVIYNKEVKEKKERKVKRYLPRLIDDLLGNIFCKFYLFASEAFNA